jgi:Rrf2 family transcriptional regulator, cysteine metabolism repressor
VIVITTKSDYGMRAAIDLARHFGSSEPVQVKEIADRQGVPKDFLSLIMVDLRRGGIVESVRGPRGGYRLTRPPAQISMGEILEVLEGPIQLLQCMSDSTSDPCSQQPGCHMRSVWSRLTDTIVDVLFGTSLEQLAGPELVEIRVPPRTNEHVQIERIEGADVRA